MTLRLLDSLSEEMRWRKVEQEFARLNADVIQLMKRAPRRPDEWVGHLPHAADAFEGAGTPGTSQPFRILEGILDGDLAQSTGDGGTETTATLSVWSGNGAAWADTTNNVTVTNRSDTYSAKAGEYLQVYETESGEFRPLLFPCVIRLGKTDASHAKGVAGNISIYTGTAGSEADNGDTVSARNKFCDLETGKWVVVARIDGDEYLVSGEGT